MHMLFGMIFNDEPCHLFIYYPKQENTFIQHRQLTFPQADVFTGTCAFSDSNSSANPQVQFLQAFFFLAPAPQSTDK